MKKVLVSIYNPSKIGGPTVAMKKLMNSYLKEEYEFVPLVISDHLGKLLRIKVLKSLISEIKKENPDVIYFTGMQIYGLYISLAAYLAGYRHKTIMVVRGSSCDDLSIGKLKKWIFGRIIEPLTVRMTEITHTVCTEMLHNRIVEKNVNISGGVIYNAAPPAVSLLPEDRENIRRELGIPQEAFLVCYSGRITMDKGIEYLLSAFTLLPKEMVLVLIGDGNDIDYFFQIVEEKGLCGRVIFTGRRSDVSKILYASDAFAFPSLHENLSNALLEACQAGLPVVATNVGGNPEVVVNGYNGYIVSARSDREIADKLKYLFFNRNDGKIMGENGKTRMRVVFSEHEIFKKIDALFKLVIEQ